MSKMSDSYIEKQSDHVEGRCEKNCMFCDEESQNRIHWEGAEEHMKENNKEPDKFYINH